MQLEFFLNTFLAHPQIKDSKQILVYFDQHRYMQSEESFASDLSGPLRGSLPDPDDLEPYPFVQQFNKIDAVNISENKKGE